MAIETYTAMTGEMLLATCDFEILTPGKSPSEDFARQLQKDVFGQEEATHIVAQEVINSKAGFTDPKRPKSSFLFLGPTGVGKTKTAKTLAKILDIPFIPIDCTQLQEGSSITRLKGTEPKYVGYGDPTLLMPDMISGGGVVTFDEIEKAHPEVWKWLMPVLDEGQTTLFLPTGKPNPNGAPGQQIAPTKLDFTNTYIVMTSNEGAEAMHAARKGGNKIGFQTNRESQNPDSNIATIALDALRSGRFKSYPEFLGRIRHIIVFNELDETQYLSILDEFVHNAMNDLITNKPNEAFNLIPTTVLKKAVLEQSGTAQYGARDIERAVRKTIIDAVAEYRVSGAITPGSSIVADYVDGAVKFFKLVQKPSQSNNIPLAYAVETPTYSSAITLFAPTRA